MSIGVRTRIASRQNLVTLDVEGVPVPNGDGGYTQTPVPLVPPQLFASIEPASQSDLERVGGGTVLAASSLLVRLPYHDGVTNKTRLSWMDRAGRMHVANVTGVVPNEDCSELIAVAVEFVP